MSIAINRTLISRVLNGVTKVLLHFFYKQTNYKYSKTCVKRPLSKKTNYHLMQVKSIDLQNAPRGAFCNTYDLH